MVKAGTVLGGKYQLRAPVGEGGMGTIWRARRLELDADIAVKVMHEKAARKDGAAERFNREARSAAGINSPHVVRSSTTESMRRRQWPSSRWSCLREKASARASTAKND